MEQLEPKPHHRFYLPLISVYFEKNMKLYYWLINYGEYDKNRVDFRFYGSMSEAQAGAVAYFDQNPDFSAAAQSMHRALTHFAMESSKNVH